MHFVKGRSIILHFLSARHIVVGEVNPITQQNWLFSSSVPSGERLTNSAEDIGFGEVVLLPTQQMMETSIEWVYFRSLHLRMTLCTSVLVPANIRACSVLLLSGRRLHSAQSEL